MGVEEAVAVVYEAEKHRHSVFQEGSEWVCWVWAIRGSFCRGFGWPPLYRQSMQHTSSSAEGFRIPPPCVGVL